MSQDSTPLPIRAGIHPSIHPYILLLLTLVERAIYRGSSSDKLSSLELLHACASCCSNECVSLPSILKALGLYLRFENGWRGFGQVDFNQLLLPSC